MQVSQRVAGSLIVCHGGVLSMRHEPSRDARGDGIFNAAGVGTYRRRRRSNSFSVETAIDLFEVGRIFLHFLSRACAHACRARVRVVFVFSNSLRTRDAQRCQQRRPRCVWNGKRSYERPFEVYRNSEMLSRGGALVVVLALSSVKDTLQTPLVN